jgi:hypothetical protein
LDIATASNPGLISVIHHHRISITIDDFRTHGRDCAYDNGEAPSSYGGDGGGASGRKLARIPKSHSAIQTVLAIAFKELTEDTNSF